VEGSCEYGNELLGSIKCGKLLSSCTNGDLLRRAEIHGVSLFHDLCYLRPL
jgi:hypothetical protein